MKIASWNVNSLRVRLPQVLAWLAQNRPDVLALQETKVADDQFPVTAFADHGWYVCYSGQKTYNGVAVVSRNPVTEVTTEIAGLAGPERRVLTVTIDGVKLYNLYVPNGKAVGSDSYHDKLDWLARLRDHLATEPMTSRPIAVVGDFNIAPADADVHDPTVWAGAIHCSQAERTALTDLQQLGLTDTFRQFEQPAGSFSWWDYRGAAFPRNRGLRIDLVLASPPLAAATNRSWIDRGPRGEQRPSDHAPVAATFEA